MPDKLEDVRLLFVDDDIDFLTSASRVLARRGIVVTEAHNGPEALELLKNGLFEVVVLDQKMPRLDGVEVFHQIHKHYPDLPVIILTGHGTVSAAFETSKSGVHDYLMKPCDTQELADKIHSAARRGVIEKSPTAASIESSAEIRVLMIDDEEEFLTSLTKVLKRRKITLLTAETGEDGLELLEHAAVDVVVLDVKMPGMDGLEALKRIKSKYPALEVLLLTGHPNVSDAHEGVRRGAFDYLVKPPDVEELTRKIRAAYRKMRDDARRRQSEAVRSILENQPD